MRKRKTIKIDDREFTVKELTVKEILEILDEAGGSGSDEGGPIDQIQDLKALVEKHLVKATDAKIDDFKGMAPSEIKQIVDAFREVNSVFFDAAQRLGLGHLLGRFKSALLKDFLELAAGSFTEGT
ncbi:MAG: hypothetical protein JRJ66_02100 [Deltaproteobacteria bacterium]|nr:hypothetical protein [Deltaproteobacteria bacterium]